MPSASDDCRPRQKAGNSPGKVAKDCCALPCLRPRMGGAIDGAEAGGIDVGVALCGRKAGVPQELLDGAKVAAGAQEVRGEGVAERMRRYAVGEPQLMAQLAYALLHDGGIEWPAARAQEEGVAGAERLEVGAGIAVGDQGLDGLRQERHQPGLVALAGDAERVLAALQQTLDRTLGEPQRL